MRLAFEDVSYSYEGGEAKKRRGRRKKDAARQADWGNAPDAVWALRDVTFTVEPLSLIHICCGGCRARAAYYHDGDILAQDDYCAHGQPLDVHSAIAECTP